MLTNPSFHGSRQTATAQNKTARPEGPSIEVTHSPVGAEVRIYRPTAAKSGIAVDDVLRAIDNFGEIPDDLYHAIDSDLKPLERLLEDNREFIRQIRAMRRAPLDEDVVPVTDLGDRIQERRIKRAAKEGW